MTVSPLFVWVRGLKGPTPEKWPEMLVDMKGSPIPTLVSHELTEAEYWLSFHQLMKKYPAPEMENVK